MSFFLTLLYPGVTSSKMQIPRKSSWPCLTHRPISGPEKGRLPWAAFDKLLGTGNYNVSKQNCDILQEEAMKAREAKTIIKTKAKGEFDFISPRNVG